MSQPEFTPDVIGKAHKLLGAKTADGQPKMLQDPAYTNIWWVTPSSGSASRYRVQTDYDPRARTLTWITCTCPHGLNKGAGTTRCYHAAAALMLLKDQWIVEDHRPTTEPGWNGVTGCTCGWPTEADFAMHTPKWDPDFSEHLLDERRKA